MRLSVLRVGIGILFLTVGSGCGLVTVVSDPLPLPDRPVLYHWPSGALECLAEPVAIGIKINQVKLVGWGETMERVIRATHKSKD